MMKSDRAASKKEGTKQPEPKVVEVKIEKVDEDYIEYLRKNPIKRPPTRTSPRHRETCRAADDAINKVVDLDEHILEEYDTKGYAMVRVEYLDNGRKRLFRVPEGVEEDAAAAYGLQDFAGPRSKLEKAFVCG